MSDRLILIGYRGSGKTTVGRLAAAALGWPFADADDHVEAAAGMTIRDIFAAEGEAGFRDLEEAAIAELTARRGLVLATGGGAVLRAANRDRLRAGSVVVWLTAPPEVLWHRMQADAATHDRRPNLAGGGLEEVTRLLAVRDPLYRGLADLEIPVGEVSPAVAVDRILAAWAARQPAGGSPTPT